MFGGTAASSSGGLFGGTTSTGGMFGGTTSTFGESFVILRPRDYRTVIFKIVKSISKYLCFNELYFQAVQGLQPACLEEQLARLVQPHSSRELILNTPAFSPQTQSLIKARQRLALL